MEMGGGRERGVESDKEPGPKGEEKASGQNRGCCRNTGSLPGQLEFASTSSALLVLTQQAALRHWSGGRGVRGGGARQQALHAREVETVGATACPWPGVFDMFMRQALGSPAFIHGYFHAADEAIWTKEVM